MHAPIQWRWGLLVVLGFAALPNIAQASSYSAAVSANSPVSYYRLEETSGTSAADLGSANIAGTYTGNYTQGQAGIPGGDTTDNAAAFNTNGTYTGYVGVPSYTAITNYPVTIEAFIKTSTANGSDATPEIAGIASTTDSASNLCIDLQSGVAGLKFRNDAAQNLITGGGNIANGSWHQVVGVFDSATQRELYVDGTLANSSTISTTFPTGINTFGIGTLDRATPADYINGTIDEVSVYNTALTAAQIHTQFVASGVPEPASIGLLAVSACALLIRRRKVI
ncbi:MAG TPA: LamG-like jellyroll fold domain-containing protein [Tepidisphaeraceae bacterium]|jgi:hypothetical protein|nr:LamG-like jellyroll fold domain-containing protein [Tepidisphaeraceae bacterium]